MQLQGLRLSLLVGVLAAVVAVPVRPSFLRPAPSRQLDAQPSDTAVASLNRSPPTSLRHVKFISREEQQKTLNAAHAADNEVTRLERQREEVRRPRTKSGFGHVCVTRAGAGPRDMPPCLW